MPTGKVLYLVVPIVLLYKSIEFLMVQKLSELGKNILSTVHGGKIRPII
jgi:hypothetical protein